MRNPPNETRSNPLDRTSHRKCILTGESFSPEQLVRLAMGPDGQIAPDVRAKAPGREALKQATLDRLGLEARGGTLLTGSEKIETAARRDDLVMLLHASDAGQDGSSKLAQAWRVGSDREGDDLRGITLPVDRQGLSVALGRQNVVHIGIIDKRAAERVSHMLARWIRFMGSDEMPGAVEEKVA